VLDQADRLAEHGTAHAVAVEQLGFGPQHLADRPPLLQDVIDDPVGDGGSQLAARRAGTAGHTARWSPPRGRQAPSGTRRGFHHRVYFTYAGVRGSWTPDS
jgi:hypothetical protein